ncbi:MAG: hypothetical protein RR150_11860, partial [Clostridia bacterium]
NSLDDALPHDNIPLIAKKYMRKRAARQSAQDIIRLYWRGKDLPDPPTTKIILSGIIHTR